MRNTCFSCLVFTSYTDCTELNAAYNTIRGEITCILSRYMIFLRTSAALTVHYKYSYNGRKIQPAGNIFCCVEADMLSAAIECQGL